MRHRQDQDLTSQSSFEEIARKVAHVIGPSSAAALALDHLEKLREQGKEAEIFFTKGSWIVQETPKQENNG